MKKSFVLSLCALVCAVTAHAEIVYNNIDAGVTGGATFGTSVGQSFVTGNISLTLNTFAFAQTTTGTDYAPTAGQTVSLYSNNPLNNTPLAQLTTLTVYPAGGNITGADTDPTVPTILTANTRYWLVLSAPTTVAWTYYTNNVSPSPYGVYLPTDNTAFKVVNGVPTYFPLSAGPQSIYLDADVLALPTAPEPSTYAMLALGGVGALLFVRRTRVAKTA